jgi:hypothetical protein
MNVKFFLRSQFCGISGKASPCSIGGRHEAILVQAQQWANEGHSVKIEVKQVFWLKPFGQKPNEPEDAAYPA